MSNVPDTNVVAVFKNAAEAATAAQGLQDEGFSKDKITVMPQGAKTAISVQADGRHAEASASLEDDGATSVQNVAR